MTRRFWIGVALGAPVFLLTMGDMLSGGTLVHRLGTAWVNWISFALATPVVLWCGWPFFHRMRASFVNRSPNMFTLIGLGVGTAYGYSAVATVAPRPVSRQLPHARRGRDLLRHGRRHHRAGAARAGAGAARAPSHRRRRFASCSASRRRPRGSCAAAARTTCRSTRCRSATCCASARARRFRSTASSSTAPPRWTSRWSPASRSRWTSGRATA